MTSRDDLHRLVDSLPEGAFPSIRFGLELLQSWPEHPSTQQVMTKMREFMKERGKERSLFAGTVPAMAGLGLFGLAQGNKIPGGNTFSYTDGDTYVLDTKLNHRGHQIKTTERLRLDREDRKFHYAIEVTGPDGQFARHEFAFAVDPTAEPHLSS
jgi:hypothetical protein